MFLYTNVLEHHYTGTIIRDKDTIFATELSKFDEIIDFLKESVGEKQKELIEQIVNTNQAYRKSRDVSEATSKREQVLQNIQIALVESEEISEHLREGQAFFQNLNEKIRVLEVQVSDFLSSRRRDAEERSADIEEEKAYVTTVPVGPSNNVLDAIPVTSSNSSYQQQFHQQVSAPPMTSTYDTYNNNVVPPPEPEPVRAPKKMPPPPSYGNYGSTTSISSSSSSSYDAPAYNTSTYGSSSSSYGTKAPSSNDGYGSSTYGSSTYGTTTTTTSSAPSYGSSTSSNQSTMPPPPDYNSQTTSVPRDGPFRSQTNNFVPEPVRAYPPTYGTNFNAPPPPKYGDTTTSSSMTTNSSLPPYGSSSYSQYGGGDKYASALSKLQGMGFDANQAKRALQKHNGDVDKAVNELLGM